MPEFEEERPNTSQSQSYTPSTDASKKPRTRRRSGGFKTEVASVSSETMGEVSAAEALKKEKLSGKPTPSEPRAERESKPRRERSERKPRADREPRQKREPRESAKQAPRTGANPQPSPETLAAIASVEAKITERRAERDARRAERNKNRPSKSGNSERKSKPDRSPANKPTPAAAPTPSEGGLIAAIGGFFSKLLGNEPTPSPQKSGNRGDSDNNRRAGSRPPKKSGNRSGQNRSGGREGKGGKRSGQDRAGGRGGKGPRQSGGRNKENANS